MVNKNYLLIAGLATAMAVQPALAQESSSWSGRDMTYRGQSYDVLDTAYVPDSRMEQQREYLDHKYAFPAMPRNMWELGLNVGMVNLWGDVTSKTPFTAPKPLHTMGFGVSLRKAWGYTMSWRLNYNYLNASGFDYRNRDVAVAGGAFSGYTGQVFNNYRYTAHELTLQLVGAINNIKFHRARNTVSLHGFLGGGALAQRTLVATKDASNNAFPFASWVGKSKDDVNSAYKSLLSNASYDYVVKPNSSPNTNPQEPIFGDFYLVPALVGGVGVQFKLGNRVSLQIEDKITWTGLDKMDGVYLDPSVGGGLSSDKDILNYASVGLGFNLGNASRRVAPLWWVNPLDHVYTELADPRHMSLPNPVLADTDGDGVADQFDRCPDTPLGVAVDAKGCPLDTDADGVPDYRDKEIITPTTCQPVNADGVGKCPCPEGCETVVPASSCNTLINAGALGFSNNSASLSNSAKSQLSNLAAQMNANPTCVVVISGNQGGSKLTRQRSWDRVNAVIDYMSNNLQISRSRFIFRYDGYGDVNSVEYRAANPGETGSSTVAPPHPHLGTNR